jgi:acetolactate synthase small subunit
MAEQRWVFVIKAQDKPGAVTAAAGVFSNRGVSLETILGSGMTLTGVDSRIVLSFRAMERKKDMLMRALERLSAVLQVDCYAYSSPELRAIAVVRVSAASDSNWQASDVQTEIVSESNNSQTMMLTGGTSAVEQMVETMREHNALLDVAMSVMAV